MPTVNEQIRDRLIGHQANLINYAETLGRDLTRDINKTNTLLNDYLKTKLSKVTTQVNSRQFQKEMTEVYKELIKIRNVNTLSIQTRLIEKNIKARAGMKGAEIYFKQQMLDVALSEVEYMNKVIHEPVYLDFTSYTVPKTKIINTVGMGNYSGQTITQWFKKLKEDDTKRILSTVRAGLVSSQNPNEIIKAVFSTDIAKTMRGAEALSRTMTNGVANYSRMDFYKANADILLGLQFLATLDYRTTELCGSLDGKIYKKPENCPQPPLHVNCRSTTVPALASDKLVDRTRPEIADRNFRDEGRKLFIADQEKNGLTTKEAKNLWQNAEHTTVSSYRVKARNEFGTKVGKISDKVSYEQWLKSKPLNEVAIALKSQKKAKLFMEGKYKLKGFSTSYDKNLTLNKVFEK